MRPETKARNQLFWSMALICLAGAMLLLIPVWPEKHLLVYAVLFWLILIAAYALLALANRWRRKDQKTADCPAEYRSPPGALRLGKTAVTRIFGVIALAGVVFILVRLLTHAPAASMDYIAAAAVFIAVQLRAILAGRNWRYTQYVREIKKHKKKE